MARSLKKGDYFKIVAASSPINDIKDLQAGIKVLQDWGLICSQIGSIDRSWGYLAGTDEIRYEDLHPNDYYPLLAFARGGWGSARLLERVQPWKEGWLIGFSDVTSILLARLANGFHGSIHGPLITTLGTEPQWSKNRLKSILFGNSISDLYADPWGGGIAQGHLIVGNLTVMTHLIGTSHLPDFKESILIIEDVGEAPYRIDRMLTQLRLTGLLKQISGIGFGSFSNCHDDADINESKSFKINDILRDRTKDLNIPIISNLPIGHCCGNASLPLGSQAVLDGDKGRLSIIS